MTETFLIDGHTTIGDIVTSNIKVSASSTLIINGIVNGQIEIDKSAKVIVNGILNGNILNFGTCIIYGTINGDLFNNGGTLEVDKKASINSINN